MSYTSLYQYVSNEISNTMPLDSPFCSVSILFTESNDYISLFYGDNKGITIQPINNVTEDVLSKIINKQYSACLGIRNKLPEDTLLKDLIYTSLYNVFKNQLKVYKEYFMVMPKDWFHIDFPKNSTNVVKECENIVKSLEYK